jgi:hypothetical protein
MTKICPRCKKTYSDFTKVCRLPHCPNCGSSKLEPPPSLLERVFLWGSLGFFFLPGLYIVFLWVLALFDVIPPLTFEFVQVAYLRAGVVSSVISSIAGIILWGKWHCKNCDENFYFPVRNVPLVTLTNTQVQGAGIEVKENACPVCGAPVEPGAKYCWRCGARLS